MTGRLLGPVFTMLLSATLPVLGKSAIFAQPFPFPLPGSLNDLLTNPSQWLIDRFNDIVEALSQRTTTDVLGLMNWLLSSGNVVSSTPPALSYENQAVQQMWGTVMTIAYIGLGVVAAWAGINAMIRPHIRAPYNGVLEVLPRLVLSGALIYTSLSLGRFAIDLNNLLCAAIGSTDLSTWSAGPHESTGANVLLNLVALLIYAIMGMLLFGQMMMRIALLDALLIVGPLAVLCWALPQTQTWARVWFSTFFATVFVQFLQVLVLHLGAELITHLPLVFGSGVNSLDAGRLWLATLLLGMAVLQLARKVPRLMPGYATGAYVTHDTPMNLWHSIERQIRNRSSSSGRK